MLYWAVVFFILSLVAGLFGFGGLSEGFETIAQIFFGIFVFLFIITVAAGAWVGSKIKGFFGTPK